MSNNAIHDTTIEERYLRIIREHDDGTGLAPLQIYQIGQVLGNTHTQATIRRLLKRMTDFGALVNVGRSARTRYSVAPPMTIEQARVVDYLETTDNGHIVHFADGHQSFIPRAALS